MKTHRDFIEGFRITRQGDYLTIESTDYHARPLRLTAEDLAAFGLRFSERKGPRRSKQCNVDDRPAPLLELMERPQNRSR